MTKLLGFLIGLLVVWVVAIGAVVVAAGPAPNEPPLTTSFSHSVLERDRVMTERMSLDATMPMQGDGMWIRSADPAYLTALERHTAEVDKMIGRTPR